MLIKYCRPEHNLLKGCSTLQLGTLEYYRTKESDKLIADDQEGQHQINVMNVNSLSATGASVKLMERLGLVAINGAQIQMDCQLTEVIPNCLIWCCSRYFGERTSVGGERFDPEYSSSYSISDPQWLIDIMALSLLNLRPNQLFDEGVLESLKAFSIADLRQIQLIACHRPVVYVPEKISTLTSQAFETYAPEISEPLRPLFVKPKRFDGDQEYRFAFQLQHPRIGILPVRKSPVIVSLLPVTSSVQ